MKSGGSTDIFISGTIPMISNQGDRFLEYICNKNLTLCYIYSLVILNVNTEFTELLSFSTKLMYFTWVHTSTLLFGVDRLLVATCNQSHSVVGDSDEFALTSKCKRIFLYLVTFYFIYLKVAVAVWVMAVWVVIWMQCCGICVKFYDRYLILRVWLWLKTI